jgi:nitric oxide synthase oxygenase domain/subunit
MKGTGFKDKKTAIDTIKIISYRSPTYQFNVINTMFNRAKFHPHQTSEMRDAMKIFAGWLKKYAYMSKADIIASGVKSDFIDKLEEVGWKYYKLQYLPIGANGKYDYLSWRDFQIEKLLDKSSKKKLLEFAYLF